MVKLLVFAAVVVLVAVNGWHHAGEFGPLFDGFWIAHIAHW